MSHCYASKWRLFKGRPDIETKGCYVFCPDDTPSYNELHNYGSRFWTWDKDREEPLLGEVSSAVHTVMNGQLRGPYPRAVLLGLPTCISEGETYPPSAGRELTTGWDSRCYSPIPAPPPDPPVLDVRHCRTQQRLALVLEKLYVGDGSTAEAELQDWFPTAVISRVPNSASEFPGSLIAIVGTTTIVIVSGTSNFQQWALQGFSFVNGLNNYGHYRTLRLWRDAAQELVRRLRDAGAPTSGHVVFAGHSYGGAVACILASMYTTEQPSREIHLFTLGCPKPGDNGLIKTLDGLPQVHLFNEDDPIPFLPPSGNELLLYRSMVPELIYNRWLSYRRPRGLEMMDINGNRSANADPGTYFSVIARMISQLALNQTPAVIFAHNCDEYRRRIRCPADPNPTPLPDGPALWLRPDELVGYTPGDALSTWVPHAGETPAHGAGTAAPLVSDDALSLYGVTLSQRSSPLPAVSRYVSFDTIGLADWTIFAVTRLIGPSLGGPVVASASTFDFLPMSYNGTSGLFIDLEGEQLVGGGVAADFDPHIWATRREGLQWTLWKDEVQLATAAKTATVGSVARVLSNTGITTFRDVRLLELIIFPRAVTGSELDALWDMLRSRYGV